MNQEVVISPETLFHLLKGYDHLNLNSVSSEFFKHLQSDKLCLDETNIILDALLDQIISDGSPEIMQLWTGLVQHINQLYYKVESQGSEANRIDLCEGELARKSSDHLWVKRSWKTEKNKKLKSQFDNSLRFIPWQRYVNPTKQDFLLRNGRVISLKKGDVFPLFPLLEKCMEDSDFVLISDGYIPANDQSIINLEKIISRAPEKCKIGIQTLSDSTRNYKKLKDEKSYVLEVKEKLNHLFPDKSIFIKTIKSKVQLHERSIVTRQWFIALGGGLDRHEDDKVTRQTTIGIIKGYNDVNW